MKYYIDTCIWLNLFKKEEDVKKNIVYWKITKDFITKTSKKNNIIVSTIVLKELEHILGSTFPRVKKYLSSSPKCIIVRVTHQDYEKARFLEFQTKSQLSFYDYLHIAIAMRFNTMLITRDKDMITIGKKYVQIKKPEALLR